MSSEWTAFTELLTAIVDNRGKTCPVGEVGLPLIATNCIDGESLHPRYDTTRFVDESTYATWFRGHPLPGDILFVCKGSPGRTAVAPDPVDFCIAQDMVAIRADNRKISPKYLFAALRSKAVQDQIANMHVGTMIPHFKKGDFGKLLIPRLARHQEAEIGDLHYEICERIRSLHETNATLEAIAQALFKSWFVDFDPVRAKRDGRVPEGMDEATAALFPDSFEDSELGEVPRGWDVRAIGDCIDMIGGATPDTKIAAFWSPEEFAWTTPKDLSGATSPALIATERKLSAAGLAKIGSGLLPAGSLLMSSRAPIGYLAIADLPVAINQGYIGMLPGGALPPLYMLRWCQVNMEQIKGRANGSTFMEISKKAFRPIPAVLPGKDVIAAYLAVAQPLFARVIANERQALSLTEIRDTLLPRLISGQLRFPEAAKAIEPALA